MQSFRLDPYLWVHIAGLAALPLLLEICLFGLAVGYPILPPGLEVAVLAAIGIIPVLWMQWQRPFYIFSLLVVALQPEQLTETERRMLRFFRTPLTRLFSLVAPIFLAWALWRLYQVAPVAADFTPIPTRLRIVGLLVAAIAFLASNLFLQVPISALRILLVSPSALDAAEPYAPEQVKQDFTLIGLRVGQLLPKLQPETATPSAPDVTSEATSEASETATESTTTPTAAPTAAPEAEIAEVAEDQGDTEGGQEMATATAETAETAEESAEPESTEPESTEPESIEPKSQESPDSVDQADESDEWDEFEQLEDELEESEAAPEASTVDVAEAELEVEDEFASETASTETSTEQESDIEAADSIDQESDKTELEETELEEAESGETKLAEAEEDQQP